MTTGIALAEIYQSKYGDTVETKDPKREAYKQAGYILNVLRRYYTMTAHPDGAYTVQGDGLASLTFERKKQPIRLCLTVTIVREYEVNPADYPDPNVEAILEVEREILADDPDSILDRSDAFWDIEIEQVK